MSRGGRLARLKEFLVGGALMLALELGVGGYGWWIGQVWVTWICAGVGGLVAVAWGLVWVAYGVRRRPRVWVLEKHHDGEENHHAKHADHSRW
jgi:hypothetical protein